MTPTGRQQDRSLRLAVCEKNTEAQEALAAGLRSAGTASRISAFHDDQALSELLEQKLVDVIVWGEGSGHCSMEAVVARATQFRVPVVVAADTLSAESFSRLRLAGASDVYVREDRALMIHVVRTQGEIHGALHRADQAQAAIEETDRRCDALLEAMADPVAYLSEGLHIKANAAYLEMLGFASFEDLEGLSLMDFVSPEDVGEVREKIKRLGRGSGDTEEMELTLSTGARAKVSFASATYEAEPCLQVSVRREMAPVSVSVLPATPAGVPAPGAAPPSLEDWLKRDPASSLFNRTHFLEQISEANSGYAWAVQLERHEQIVAEAGPTQLDSLVAGLGKLLSAALPEGTLVARWTAAQVAVLSPEASLEAIQSARQALERDFMEAAGKSFPASIVAGGVVINDTLSPDQVVLCMDKALREAKQDTAHLHLIDPMGSEKAHAKEVAGRLDNIRHALENDKLFLLYQPIVSLLGGPEAYETTVRMHDDQGNVLEPHEFMPLAAEHGLSEAIDRWVVQRAIQDVSQRQLAGKKINLVAKVSVASIKDDALPRQMKQWLADASVAPDQIWVEMSMSVASTNAKEARQFRDALFETGSPIVLSGFPMDPTAFRMAEVISPAWLKLSREFVVDLGQSQEKQDALSAVVAQASESGTKVLVGFVEDAMLLTTLFTMGVDAAQGNFLSPPLPKMTYDFSQLGG